MSRNILELNTSIEMVNTLKDNVTIKVEVKFKQMVSVLLFLPETMRINSENRKMLL